MCQDDYDSPWKEALVKYLPQFFEFFFPHIFEDVDWNKAPEFLDKELPALAPTNQENKRGGPRVVDTLVELQRVSGEVTRILVHIEIQAQKKADFERRLFLYHSRILERHAKPLCSLVILADRFSNWRPSSFGHNVFALLTASTLHAQATRQGSKLRYTAKSRLIRGLHYAGLSEKDVRTLFKLIDWILTLSPRLKDLFWVELKKMEQETGMPYITSIEQMGREDGLREGRREAVFDTLEARFGPIPESIRTKLGNVSKLERLRELGRLAVTVESLEDFQQQLGTPG